MGTICVIIVIIMMIIILVIIIIIIACTHTVQHYTKFPCPSHEFSLVMGPVRSSTNLTPWGAYGPSVNTPLVII